MVYLLLRGKVNLLSYYRNKLKVKTQIKWLDTEYFSNVDAFVS